LRRIRKSAGTTDVRANKSSNSHFNAVARQMLLYPIAYTLVILPIAVARFTAFAGYDVPFSATIFCDTVYMLSGTINVVLFVSTRRLITPQASSFKAARELDSLSLKPIALPHSSIELEASHGNSIAVIEHFILEREENTLGARASATHLLPSVTDQVYMKDKVFPQSSRQM